MAQTGFDTFTETSNTPLESHTSDSGTTWALVPTTLGSSNLSRVNGFGDYAQHITNGGATGWAYKLAGSAGALAFAHPHVIEADLRMATSTNTEFNALWARGEHNLTIPPTGSASIRGYGAALLQSSSVRYCALFRWGSGSSTFFAPGGPTTLATHTISGFSGTTDYNVRMHLHNDGDSGAVEISVFLDDAEVIDYTDNSSSKIIQGQLIGLVARRTSGNFRADNFLCYYASRIVDINRRRKEWHERAVATQKARARDRRRRVWM